MNNQYPINNKETKSIKISFPFFIGYSSLDIAYFLIFIVSFSLCNFMFLRLGGYFFLSTKSPSPKENTINFAN